MDERQSTVVERSFNEQGRICGSRLTAESSGRIAQRLVLFSEVSTTNRRVRNVTQANLPDSWRGHSVRAPAQVNILRDKSGKMPELRPCKTWFCHCSRVRPNMRYVSIRLQKRRSTPQSKTQATIGVPNDGPRVAYDPEVVLK